MAAADRVYYKTCQLLLKNECPQPGACSLITEIRGEGILEGKINEGSNFKDFALSFRIFSPSRVSTFPLSGKQPWINSNKCCVFACLSKSPKQRPSSFSSSLSSSLSCRSTRFGGMSRSSTPSSRSCFYRSWHTTEQCTEHQSAHTNSCLRKESWKTTWTMS